MTHPWPFKSIPGAHEGGTGDGLDAANQEMLYGKEGILEDANRMAAEQNTAYLRLLLKHARGYVQACSIMQPQYTVIAELLADIDKELGR